MASPYTLFEVSWEVCNKLGGIHTVLSSKARTSVARFGDEYIVVGPWRLSEGDRATPFEEDAGFREFSESCRRMGLPVRVGRWLIPGEPRALLVEFSQLYDQKNDILAALWDDFGVDSISGGWDYAEPVLFGYAAGRVIEKWWQEHLAPYRRGAVVQTHEWMTASAVLYVQKHMPAVGTVFTTHATVLGRAIAEAGRAPMEALAVEAVDALAESYGVVPRHSLEGVGARTADVFTTVSALIGKEAERIHQRAPEPITYNGIDLSVVDEFASGAERAEVRRRLDSFAARFLDQDVGQALHLAISGRYEPHNKGLDLALDALGRVNAAPGRELLFWIFVPAGHGPAREPGVNSAAAVSTHVLFEADEDPIQRQCTRLGLTNARGARVHVIHVPVYLGVGDGFLELAYETVLKAMDLTCFPSIYEPWGYTPQESLALGVPTITTAQAGFGRWALARELGPADGLTVLDRGASDYEAQVAALSQVLEAFAAAGPASAELIEACRRTAALTSWKDLFGAYEAAYAAALEFARVRAETLQAAPRRPELALPVQPALEAATPRLLSFDVSATLPDTLRGLDRLARNLWWCWQPEGARLFEDLSPRAWQACDHNPLALLRRVYPEDLDAKARDPEYAARLQRLLADFQDYVSKGPLPIPLGDEEGALTLTAEHPIAYFCAEYGLHESLRIYSGGLGVLAGDHLKSASDMRLPFVAVGLFYSRGYLEQRVTPAGEQVAVEIENDPLELPLEQVQAEDGSPLQVVLQLPGRELHLRALRAEVGRVQLYLLDANTPSNRPEDRDITSRLYAGDQEARILQEIVLGRGGFRLLKRLGIEAGVFHLNEGHAAFLVLERLAHLVREEGYTFEEARELVRANTAFTTHTPVPAGHDRFGEDLMRRYFSDLPDRIGIPWEAFYALGHSARQHDAFNMTHLALHFASFCNGVSELHGIASRKLLHGLWPGLLESEVPIRSITNGVHLATWTHPGISALLGAADRPVRGEDFARRAEAVDARALWDIKRGAKSQLLEGLRDSLRQRFLEQRDSPLLLTKLLDGLHEDALYIGFARRFAPYKRANLIFKDPERLLALLDDPVRPLRILVSGKAHPNDERGREILRGIHATARQDQFAGKVIFVENYEIDLARYLVQGVDLWLNNPTRMLEASGTSGMKAAANGALNLSIGDGWWPEAEDGRNGWTIGDGSVYEDGELQDQLDSATLYRLLEEEIVPLYFERDAEGLPREWLQRVRHNLLTIPPRFNTDRMVGDYRDQAYAPAARRGFELTAAGRAGVAQLARERQRIRRDFADISIVAARIADLAGLKVGDPIEVQLEVELGALKSRDVLVELVLGHSTGDRDLGNMTRVPLECTGARAGSRHTFSGRHRMERSGVYSYGIRVRPSAATQAGSALADLMLWA